MSIADQLSILEADLNATLQKCHHLQQENRSLQKSKQTLQAQCDELLKKNQQAKVKLELLLSQLTQMELENV